MLRYILSLILAVGLLVCSGGCGQTRATPTASLGPAPSAASEPAVFPIVLKIGCQSAENSSEVKVLKQLEYLAEQYSDGALDIKIYPASQLGSLSGLMDGVTRGTIEMATIGMNSYMAYDPDFAVYDLWSFEGPEEFIRLYNSPVGERMNQDLIEDAGIHILSYNLCSTGRLYFWGNERITMVGDYGGLHVRTNSSATNSVAISAFGATAIIVPWSDMLTALQSKVIDVAFGDVENMITSGYTSMVTYRYDGPQNFLGSSVCISEKVWEVLPEALQVVLEQAAVEACQTYGNALYDSKISESEAALDKAGIETVPMAPGEKEKMADLIHAALADYLATAVSQTFLDEVQSAINEPA